MNSVPGVFRRQRQFRSVPHEQRGIISTKVIKWRKFCVEQLVFFVILQHAIDDRPADYLADHGVLLRRSPPAIPRSLWGRSPLAQFEQQPQLAWGPQDTLEKVESSLIGSAANSIPVTMIKVITAETMRFIQYALNADVHRWLDSYRRTKYF